MQGLETQVMPAGALRHNIENSKEWRYETLDPETAAQFREKYSQEYRWLVQGFVD